MTARSSEKMHFAIPKLSTCMIAAVFFFPYIDVFKTAHADTLTDVYAAWTRRQERTKSVRIEWAEVRTTTRGSKGQTEAGELLPPKDTTHEIRLALSIDGNKVQHSWDGPSWQDALNRFVAKSYVRATDTEVNKALYTKHSDGRSDEEYPVGFVHGGTGNDTVRGNYHVELPIYFHRAMDSEMGCVGKLLMGMSPSDSPKIASPGVINGRTCTIIEQRFGNFSRVIWVDPGREYAILRYSVMRRDVPSYQIDGKYIEHDQGGWAPSGWIINSWRDGPDGSRVLRLHAEARVTKYEVNPEFAADEFRLEFPVGTIVRDDRVDEDHLVRENGEQRKILRSERRCGAAYEDFVGTETGRAALPRPANWSTTTILVAVGIGVFLLAGGMSWYRRQ